MIKNSFKIPDFINILIEKWKYDKMLIIFPIQINIIINYKV